MVASFNNTLHNARMSFRRSSWLTLIYLTVLPVLVVIIVSCQDRQRKKVPPEVKAMLKQPVTTADTVFAISDIPPSPPFRMIEIRMLTSALGGFGPEDNPLEGYVIEFNPLNRYQEVIIQDETGVRHTFSLNDGSISNHDRSWLPSIFIPGMKVRIEMVKEEGGQSNLDVRLSTVKDTLRMQDSSPYLFGVPPAPHYKFVEMDIITTTVEGCGKIDEPLIGYVIDVFHEGYDTVIGIQDEKGVRQKCRLNVNNLSDNDKTKLSQVSYPGTKLHMDVMYCGSGGFCYIMKMKTLRR